jgi:hypothetical protein
MDQNDYIPSSSIEFYVANCLIRLVYIPTYAELLVFSIQRLLKGNLLLILHLAFSPNRSM